MGFFGNVKKGANDFIKKQQAIAKDNAEYRKKVNEKVKIAKRKAFLKEAQKQAKLRAKIQAKNKFNPTPQKSGIGGGMSAEARSLIYGGGFGSSSPVTKPQVIKKVVYNRSPKKKKSKPKTRTVVKYVEKPKPKDAVQDLLSRLPQ